MQGSVLGLILSVVASLIIAISFYWAVTHEVSTTVTTYTNQTVENRVMVTDTMSYDTADRWGTVPGSYNSSLTEDIMIMSYDTQGFSPQSIYEMQRRHSEDGISKEELLKEHTKLREPAHNNNVTLNVNRTITPNFIQGKSTPTNIVYTPTISNKAAGDYDKTANVSSVNFEALNLWWQMQNMPSFLQAWQVFSQNTNKMINQSFLNFFYAHSMYKGCFDDNIWVWGNLFNFTEPTGAAPVSAKDNATISDIWNDTRYGMGSERNLTIWIAATRNDADAIKILSNHWFSGKSQLPDTWLTSLTGDKSEIYNIIQSTNQVLKSENVVAAVADITEENMAAYQWAYANLTNNKVFGFNQTAYKNADSVYEIGMNFLLQPEIQSSGCDVEFTQAEALALFDQTPAADNVISFLNPENYYNFEEMFEMKQYSLITGRFGLTEEQAGCIYRYAHQQSSFAHEQAYANMITQGAVSTLKKLVEFFPISLAARTMAQTLSTNTYTAPATPCTTFIDLALGSGSPVVTTELCTGENFTDVNNLQDWIEPLWYNNASSFSKFVDMTPAEWASFYDVSTAGSFGEALNTALTTLMTLYDCPQNTDTNTETVQYASNCSAEWIAGGQWGASSVTLNPPVADSPYFPIGETAQGTKETLSVVTWGVKNIEVAPEYFYYTQFVHSSGSTHGAVSLTPEQVSNVTDSKYSYFGLGNTYNTKTFLYDYLNDVRPLQTPFMNDTCAMWGISSYSDVYQVINTLDWLIQQHTFGGLIQNYTQEDMVYGWNSKLVTELTADPFDVADNTNKYWQSGDAIYYDPVVTPFIHNNMWSRASNNPYISVNTGINDPQAAGRIESMNDVQYPSVPMKVGTGIGGATAYLPYRCSSANFDDEHVYTWQHGQPNAGNEITTLNMMNMQLQKQTYNASDVICHAGAGNTTCSANANLTYNSYTQNEYEKSSNFYPSDNCGTRIFSHGTSMQVTNMDKDSGMSTGYVMRQNNVLRYETIGGSTGTAHPFASLKALHGMLGATNLIPLGNTTSTYVVDPVTFVAVQYPVNSQTPTKTIQTAHTSTSTTREATAWVCVIYSILLVFFLVLAGGFIYTIRKDKEGQASKANHVLYDNLNPTKEQREEED